MSFVVHLNLQFFTPNRRCSAPNKTADYQKIYSDWCNQFEKYKLALKTWEKRKGQCSPVPVIPQLASNEVSSEKPQEHPTNCLFPGL